MGTNWKVVIKTAGDEVGAGTGANVSVVALDAEGRESEPFTIQGHGFWKNAVDVFEAKHDFSVGFDGHGVIRDVTSIRLARNTGVAAPWKVDYVLLANLDTGDIWQAEGFGWIDEEYTFDGSRTFYRKTRPATHVANASPGASAFDLTEFVGVYCVLPVHEDVYQTFWTTNPKGLDPRAKCTHVFWAWKSRGPNMVALALDGGQLTVSDADPSKVIGYVHPTVRHHAELPVYRHPGKRKLDSYEYNFTGSEDAYFGFGTVVWAAVPGTIQVPVSDNDQSREAVATLKKWLDSGTDKITELLAKPESAWIETLVGLAKMSEVTVLKQVNYVSKGWGVEVDLIAMATAELGDVFQFTGSYVGPKMANYLSASVGLVPGLGFAGVRTHGLWSVDTPEDFSGWAVVVTIGWAAFAGCAVSLVWAQPNWGKTVQPDGLMFSALAGLELELGVSVAMGYTSLSMTESGRIVG